MPFYIYIIIYIYCHGRVEMKCIMYIKIITFLGTSLVEFASRYRARAAAENLRIISVTRSTEEDE